MGTCTSTNNQVANDSAEYKEVAINHERVIPGAKKYNIPNDDKCITVVKIEDSKDEKAESDQLANNQMKNNALGKMSISAVSGVAVTTEPVAAVMTESKTTINALENATFETAVLPTYKFTKAKVVKVYDGDTFWIAVENDNEIQKFSVRLYGVDCPEMKGGTEETKKQARSAKQFVVDKTMGKIVDIRVLNNTIYEGKKQTEKFGRLLSIVWYHENGHKLNLAEALINNHHAKKYLGGTKGVDIN